MKYFFDSRLLEYEVVSCRVIFFYLSGDFYLRGIGYCVYPSYLQHSGGVRVLCAGLLAIRTVSL